MQIVTLGKQFFEGRNELPEAIEYNYQGGHHTLLIAMKNLHQREIRAVREEKAEFGLYCENGIIFFLYRFGEILGWSDSAFSWWNVAEEDRLLPSLQTDPGSRILLKIILADAATGIVEAIRVTTLSPEFTQKLHQAIYRQAMAGEFSREEFVSRSLAVYNAKTSADLANGALIKTTGGD